MLLLLFAVFLYYTIGEAIQNRGEANGQDHGGSILSGAMSPGERARLVGLVVGGLVALIVGGELTVRGAIGVASAMGILETVIALTVVAVGTSLPERATTLTAARSGQGDMAIGNIVGSNIYNLLFIWGVSVTIEPSALPSGGAVDLMVMTGFSLVLLPLVITQNRLSRLEGIQMLVGYIGYAGWILTR